MIQTKTKTKEKKVDAFEYAAFMKMIKRFKQCSVTIGLHEDAGRYTTNGKMLKMPPTVVEVGMWMEFGTEDGIPERSWMRSAIDESAGLLNQWREEMIYNIMRKGWTVEKAMNAMGFRIQVLIQNKIKSNIPPALSAAAIRRKEKEGVAPVTLIETGLLLRSVTYRVTIK